MHSILVLNLCVHHVTSRFEKVNFSCKESQYSYLLRKMSLRFEVFKFTQAYIVIFWVMTPYSFVGDYQIYEETSYFRLQG
jgi:hypothetical protein